MFFEEVVELGLARLLGGLVGGSVAAACYGVVNAATAGATFVAAAYGCLRCF
jgi:hypothetical protein